MPSCKLMKRVIDAPPSPADQDQIWWDEDLKAFGLKITPAGRKVFLVQYRPAGDRLGDVRGPRRRRQRRRRAGLRRRPCGRLGCTDTWRRVAAEHGHQVDHDPDETADDAQCQQQSYHGAQSNAVPPQSIWEPNAMRGTAVR